ncbi:MAG: hypothetical protein ACM3SY_14620 [Candidatus Omnitrophota bacterium]
MRKVLITLMIIYCGITIFPEKVADLPELNKPHAIECDGENFYILDETTVHVYSIEGCRHIRSFGQRGDGPYELVPMWFPIQLAVWDDKIMLSSLTKMVTYTKSGKPINEVVYHQIYRNLIPFQKNYVAVMEATDDKPLVSSYKTLLISSDFKNKTTLLAFSSPPLGARDGKQGFTLPLYTFIRVINNNLYVFSMQHDNEIFVFNTEGKEIRRLKVNLPRVKVTESVKKDLVDYLKSIRYYKRMKLNEEDLESHVFLRDYLPTVRLFHIKNGIIYLQTHVKKGKDYQYVLMDLNGKILRTLFLPMNLYEINYQGSFCFDKNTYYYLVDNDESENWELHKVTF